MYVCMYVCMYTYHTYVYIHIYIYRCRHVSQTWNCVRYIVCMYVCMYVCIMLCAMYVCMYNICCVLCMYIYRCRHVSRTCSSKLQFPRTCSSNIYIYICRCRHVSRTQFQVPHIYIYIGAGMCHELGTASGLGHVADIWHTGGDRSAIHERTHTCTLPHVLCTHCVCI